MLLSARPANRSSYLVLLSNTNDVSRICDRWITLDFGILVDPATFGLLCMSRRDVHLRLLSPLQGARFPRQPKGQPALALAIDRLRLIVSRFYPLIRISWLGGQRYRVARRRNNGRPNRSTRH